MRYKYFLKEKLRELIVRKPVFKIKSKKVLKAEKLWYQTEPGIYTHKKEEIKTEYIYIKEKYNFLYSYFNSAKR